MNRKERAGYRVTMVRLQDDKVTAYEPFITGWNQADGVLGRPADLLVLPDGSMLVSDDMAGVISGLPRGRRLKRRPVREGASVGR